MRLLSTALFEALCDTDASDESRLHSGLSLSKTGSNCGQSLEH